MPKPPAKPEPSATPASSATPPSTASPASAAPRIRQLTRQDIPDAMRLKDEAGWNQTPQDWERFLSASPGGCFAAEKDGRVIGTATTIVYDGLVAWIGMMLVDQRHRGGGIGTALLERTIAHLDSTGVPTMKLDATPQGKPIYARLGFVEEYGIERWVLRRPATPKPGSLKRAQSPAPGIPPDLLSLDRENFGVDRGDLLQSLCVAAPDLVLTVCSNGVLHGYALGRRGSAADHLGPWAADDPAAAAELLDEFLCRSTGPQVLVDRSCPNPWARGLLEARGFELSRPLTRMYRGTNTSPGRPDSLCAILGPEFG